MRIIVCKEIQLQAINPSGPKRIEWHSVTYLCVTAGNVILLGRRWMLHCAPCNRLGTLYTMLHFATRVFWPRQAVYHIGQLAAHGSYNVNTDLVN